MTRGYCFVIPFSFSGIGVRGGTAMLLLYCAGLLSAVLLPEGKPSAELLYEWEPARNQSCAQW